MIRLILILISLCFSTVTQGTEFKRFNVRVGPTVFFIGGNIDFDVFVSENWTLGPSFFGWGGCGNRTEEQKTREGNECNTWLSYGLRSNYYLPKDSFLSGLYIGPGLYKVRKSFAYGFSGESLSGDIDGTAATLMLGYLHRFNSWFNLSGGIGGLYFLDKPDNVIVSNSTLSTSISSGSDEQLLFELSLGFMF